MKKLGKNDTIRIGVYEGETVKDCIRKYGRKSILEILKYYDLDEEILMEYHYRSLEPHKDNPEENGQDWIQEILESPFTGGESFVTTTTQDLDGKDRNNSGNEQGFQEMFSKMKDWGKKSVHELNKRFSTDDIVELIEYNDIYPENFVEGWEENSQHWNQEEYDSMVKEFLQGFKDGLQDLTIKEMGTKTTREDDQYDYENDCWVPPVDYDPEDDNEFGPLWGPGSSYKPWIYGK